MFSDKHLIDNSKGLDKPEYHTSFLDLLKLVSKIVNKDELIDIIFDILKKYIIYHNKIDTYIILYVII